MTNFYSEVITLVTILILSIYFVKTQKLLVAVISISLISLFTAFFYLIIGAPDVALTEAAVGAAVSSCIILAALSKYKNNDDLSKHTYKTVAMVLCIILFTMLCYFTIELPIYGDPYAVTNQGVAKLYKQNIIQDTGMGSLVTGILASYRGFDTLGETFVVFTSGVAVTLILKGTHERRSKK